MPSLRKPLVISSFLLLPVVAGGFIVQERASRDGARVFDQVLVAGLRPIRRHGATQDALYEKAARGLVQQLNDPYSELFSPSSCQRFSTQYHRPLRRHRDADRQQEESVVVVRVFPHTPAEGAGVVEGRPDRRHRHGRRRGAGRLSRSPTSSSGSRDEGQRDVRPPGVPRRSTPTFTRALIHIPAVPYAISLGNKIGYIPLQQFNENAFDNDAGRGQLQAEGARGIILDMRGDPGGILKQSRRSPNLFLKQGQQIASVRGREGPAAGRRRRRQRRSRRRFRSS